jgi:hypothetical protein
MYENPQDAEELAYNLVYARRINDAIASGERGAIASTVLPEDIHRTDAANKSDVDDDTLVQAAKEALTRPSDFGYYGDLPLFQSWGFVSFQSAVSDTVERSNFRSAQRILSEVAVDPEGDGAEDADDYVSQIGVSHWLVGSADHLAVRVLEDQEGPVIAANLTYTFVRAVELAVGLRDYPVLDENDWSELEMECQDESWDGYIESLVTREIEEHFGVDDISELTLFGEPVTIGWIQVTPATYDSVGELLREIYFGHASTEWVEESASSFHNANHDVVMEDLYTLFDAPDFGICEYIPAHANAEVPAVTTLDIPTINHPVPACQQCADFYTNSPALAHPMNKDPFAPFDSLNEMIDSRLHEHRADDSE